MGPRSLFDVIVVVDWSASSTPKLGPDSIWTCEHGQPPRNISTRAAAEREFVQLLSSHHDRRVLVGFDFSFGYPHGFAAAAGLAGAVPWRATWQHLADSVTDDERNRNNRWAVAAELNTRLGTNRFWGAPPAQTGPRLTARRPPGTAPLSLRHTDTTVRSTSGRLPFAPWQLLGAGSVGSQMLTGIPVVHRLRHSPGLVQRARVWPFETGFTNDPCAGRRDAIVFAEVWPSTVPLNVGGHEVKDARQVLALSAELARLDAAGLLADRFAPTLDPLIAAAALDEEGWVLH